MNYRLIYLVSIFLLGSCTKDADQLQLTRKMLVDKTWYLDYTVQDSQTKSFIGKNTYSIQFKIDGTTNDSDGIIGSFQIGRNEQQLVLLVEGKTQNGSPANYTYQIEKIGQETLIITYTQNDLFIRKIFTTH